MSKSVVSGITPLSKKPFCIADFDPVGIRRNPKGEQRLQEIALAIIELGYKGVGFQITKLGTNDDFFHFEVDTSTPEGSMHAALFERVMAGKPLPTVKKFSKNLKHEYTFWGLTLPVPKHQEEDSQ